jgi:thioredoxin reductase
LNTLILEAKEEAGGIAVRASNPENYSGFPDKISGKEFMKQMTHQARAKPIDWDAWRLIDSEERTLTEFSPLEAVRQQLRILFLRVLGTVLQ